METFIKDGTGKGYSAQVSDSNMLKVEALSVKEISYESQRHGDAFVVNTGFIPLTTTASFSGLLYLKNIGDNSILVEKIRVCGGLSAMNSTMQVLMYANPTGGTLISNAVAGISASLNLSSTSELAADVYKGADANTVTGGFQITNFQGHSPGHSVQEYDGALIIGKNNSIAIALRPSAAMDVCIEIICYNR